MPIQVYALWGWGHLWLTTFCGWCLLGGEAFCSQCCFGVEPSWSLCLFGAEAFCGWQHFGIDDVLRLISVEAVYSWCQLRLTPFWSWSCWLLIVFQGWWCFMVVGDCSLCLFWELRPPAVKSILGLMLFSFTATSWDLDSSISQMDRPDDVWSGKSSHFLSSILPSPSPSLLPSHPTISGSLLGILDLIPLSFLATSD